MESIAQELISAHIGRFFNLGLLLAAAVGTVVLMSGLAAKILESGQDALRTLTDLAGF